VLPDEPDAIAMAAARVALYAALRWEAEHPDKLARERRSAEYELAREYLDLFTQYGRALRYENRRLTEELIQLRMRQPCVLILPKP